MKSATTVYISLGGNQGLVEETFSAALAALGATPGLRVARVSRVYRTEPQGDAAQPWFVNQVAALAVEAEHTPEGLLGVLLGIETSLGRERDPARRFGPRTLDLDVLLWGELTLATERLSIPHPRMRERAFVLVPLLELAPGLRLPDGTQLGRVLASLDYRLVGADIYQPA